LPEQLNMGKPDKRKEVTSARVATEASDLLRDPHASAKAKSVAGSALSQRPGGVLHQLARGVPYVRKPKKK